jgi:HK97 family phage prohead protease
VLVTYRPIVFDAVSEDLGGFHEVVRASAVDRALRKGVDIVALRAHDANMPLGRVSANTLRLEKDARGLLAHINVCETITYAADLIEMTERRDAPGGSFGFTVESDVWSLDDNNMPFRELLDVRLREVSVGVTWPAYRATEQAIRGGVSIAFAEKLVRQWKLGV